MKKAAQGWVLLALVGGVGACDTVGDFPPLRLRETGGDGEVESGAGDAVGVGMDDGGGVGDGAPLGDDGGPVLGDDGGAGEGGVGGDDGGGGVDAMGGMGVDGGDATLMGMGDAGGMDVGRDVGAVVDSGHPVVDMGVVDTGVVVTACKYPMTGTQACGNCGTGTQTRACTAAGSWGAWGACVGGGVCAPGATAAVSCPLGEPKTETCTSACTWSVPACLHKGWNKIADPPVGFTGTQIAAWTGSKMIVTGPSGGGLYDPATDGWVLMSAPPALLDLGRASSVWSGSKLIAVSYGATGAYDPIANTWTSLPPPPAGFNPTGASVWGSTTGEALYFSFRSIAYQPATNSWRKIASTSEASNLDLAFAWAGGEAMIYGGASSDNGSYFGSGALAYDPVADAWTYLNSPPGAATTVRANPMFQYSGSALLIFGGYPVATGNPIMVPTDAATDGFAVTPGGSWSTIASAAGALNPSGRAAAASWFGARKMWVWSGGSTVDSANRSNAVSGGAAYDPVANAWTAMSEINAPRPRIFGSVSAEFHWTGAVWTGVGGLVWGGNDAGGNALTDGAIYVP